jgi:hypothetical protein
VIQLSRSRVFHSANNIHVSDDDLNEDAGALYKIMMNGTNRQHHPFDQSAAVSGLDQ